MAVFSFFCSDSTFCIFSITILCIVDIIMLLLMLLAVYHFYGIRNYPEIKARYPMILLAQSIFNIFEIFIRNQYLIISNHMDLTINNILNASFLLIIPIICLYRVCLSNFDINYALIQSQRDWQILLKEEQHNDWYSNNKHKWGNWKWLIKKFLILWIISSLFIIAIILLFEKTKNAQYVQYIYGSLVFLYFIPIIYIYMKIPPFQDTFFIKHELSLLIRYDILIQIIWFLLIYWTYLYIVKIIQIFCIILLNFQQIIISHYWVIKQLNKNLTEYQSQSRHKQQQQRNRNICCMMNSYSMNTEPLPMRTGRARSRSVEQRLVTNKKIFNVLISNKMGIHYFFQHLISEFSAENLSFFIEAIQWLYKVINGNFHQFDTSPLGIIRFELASIVPISSINEENGDDWYSKIVKIYKKYIHSSSEQQINLPYHLQSGYSHLIEIYCIKIEVENGTFKPKTKRKTHKKKNLPILESRNLFSSDWTRKVSKRFSFKPKQTYSPKHLDLNSLSISSPTADDIEIKENDVNDVNDANDVNGEASKGDVVADRMSIKSIAENEMNINKKNSMLYPNTSTNLERHSTLVIHSNHSIQRQQSVQSVESSSEDIDDDDDDDMNNLQIVIEEVDEKENNDKQSDGNNNNDKHILKTTQMELNDILHDVLNEEEEEKEEEEEEKKENNNNNFLKPIIEFENDKKRISDKLDINVEEEIDENELNKIELSKQINLNDFISLTCNALHEILQLNYQSVARFKKTNQWHLFQQNVNLNQLLHQYGDKGCIPKKMAKIMDQI